MTLPPCTECGKAWKRPAQRGRPPQQCPTHAKPGSATSKQQGWEYTDAPAQPVAKPQAKAKATPVQRTKAKNSKSTKSTMTTKAAPKTKRKPKKAKRWVHERTSKFPPKSTFVRVGKYISETYGHECGGYTGTVYSIDERNNVVNITHGKSTQMRSVHLNRIVGYEDPWEGEE